MIGSPSSHVEIGIHPLDSDDKSKPLGLVALICSWHPGILEVYSDNDPIVNPCSTGCGKPGTLGQTIAARGRIEDQTFWLQQGLGESN